MRKKNYITIGLCLALVGSILIIAYLLYSRNDRNTFQPAPQHPQVETAPQQQPMTPKPTIVLFHAEWCGFCKKMAPEWEKAKKFLENHISVLDFEAKSNPSEIKRNDIAGFPCVRLYLNGYPSDNYIEYKGNRTADSLIDFVKDNVSKSV